ncbi:MAG: isopentenyl-diphosphate Delta-isomerase [Bacteroidetes bacterium]|nr:isopentenyl-diphosphate Delta-isomerase [Bacteroidota bacterium]
MEEQVVLVDIEDQILGYMPKSEAHEKGLLHRAISILIYNSEGKMLIQQRALSKYHWAGIWSNACCSHPRKGEKYIECATRRLKEELNFDTQLSHAFTFIYKAFDEASGLTEHELDYVFIGKFNGDIDFNREEVQAVEWISIEDLEEDIENNPDKYSFWFKIILDKIRQQG